jgi:CheY-like chemotaxis protein
MSVVGEAADGEEGREVLRHTRPDVLITAVVMPRLDGIELTRWARRELAETRIILMSATPEDAYRMKASASGADAVVSKAVLTAGLLPAIRDVMRRMSGGCGPILPITDASSPIHTILVVDDAREIRAYARDALEGFGYAVLDTGDPRHALRIVKERPVHLLLTDVMMPIMNGLELATRLEAVSPATKVVVMSGFPTADIAPSGRSFLPKPFSVKALGDTVRDTLARPSALARPHRPT